MPVPPEGLASGEPLVGNRLAQVKLPEPSATVRLYVVPRPEGPPTS